MHTDEYFNSNYELMYYIDTYFIYRLFSFNQKFRNHSLGHVIVDLIQVY